MGVLKVNVGGDWRKVGCGGASLSNIMLTVDHATYNSWLSPIVYDGDRLSANWTGMGFGTNYWVIDLGAVTFIDHVNWLLYYADPRTYTNIGLEAGVGYGPWTTIRSPATYQPSLDGSAGLDIPVGGSYRYLRFYSEGNSVNFNNEWVEVEVWAGTMGRLRLHLPDGSWVREVCDDDIPGFTDDFNRAGPALGSPWQFYNGGTFAVSSNEVSWSGTPTDFPLAVIDTGQTDIDHSVDVTAVSSGAPRSCGLAWNVVDADNYWVLHVSYWEIAIYQVVGGVVGSPVWNTTSPTNPSPLTTYRVVHTTDVTAGHGTLEAYKNGSLLVGYYDYPGFAPTSGGTKHGIEIDNTTSRLDNYSRVGVEAHPLKIEDPANPGTWITVACMTPV